MFVGALQVGDQPVAVGGELGCAHRADAVDEADRLSRQKRRGLVLAEHGEAARLVHVGGDLGEELVGRQADRDGDAELALDL